MKEALRGTLLSVLFFALIGGAPGMVAASETDCTLGMSSACGDGGSNNNGGTKPRMRGSAPRTCGEVQVNRDVATGVLIVGGLAALTPTGFGQGFGILAGIFGGYSWIGNTIRYHRMGCNG